MLCGLRVRRLVVTRADQQPSVSAAAGASNPSPPKVRSTSQLPLTALAASHCRALVHTVSSCRAYYTCYTQPRRSFEANPQCGNRDAPAFHSPARSKCTYSQGLVSTLFPGLSFDPKSAVPTSKTSDALRFTTATTSCTTRKPAAMAPMVQANELYGGGANSSWCHVACHVSVQDLHPWMRSR